MLRTYDSLNAPGAKEFYASILPHPAIWNAYDRSTSHFVLSALEKFRDASVAPVIMDLIANTLSVAYIRADNAEEDAKEIARYFVRTAGARAVEMLESYAEENTTFAGYWQGMGITLEAQKQKDKMSPHEIVEPQDTEFDLHGEELYLVALKAQLAEAIEVGDKFPTAGDSDGGWSPSPHDPYDDGYDNFNDNNDDDTPRARRTKSDSERMRYQKKTTNFYGRFLPSAEHPVPLTEKNTIEAVYGMLTNPNYKGEEGYLNILSGVAEDGEIVDALPHEMSVEEFEQVLSTCFARAELLAFTDDRLDAAADLVHQLRSFVELTNVSDHEMEAEPRPAVRRVRRATPLGELPGQNYQNEGATSLGALLRQKLDMENTNSVDAEHLSNTHVNRHWTRKLNDLLVDIERRMGNERRMEGKPADDKLPQSADPFFVYHEGFKKMRRVPAFTELLTEKIRHIAALRLANPTNHEYHVRMQGEFKKQTDLYRAVEEQDVPVYWEAQENLDEAGANRLAVFGRDGKYLFTALKADNFGTDKRTLKYVLVTRNIKESESRETIARYLSQQGVDLDFHFVDTGYRGSIPELAIESLASAGGIEIPSEEVDERIKLLSSSTMGRQALGARHARRTRQDVVHVIEGRPLPIESPSNYEITEDGKLVPEEQTTDISTQLSAWVVEHAVMRNFAPRFDEGPRRKHHESEMRGYAFLERFHGGSVVSTHPMELWQGPKGEKILLKGGPEHTQRADYVGARMFEQAGLRVPHTELIQHDGELRMRMEYLEGWEDGPAALPERMHTSENIQKGFLIDLLLQQYDRASWNMMFKDNGYGYRGTQAADRAVAFIDNGAALHSRARGGFKGFRDHITVEDIAEILEHPERPGQPVNEAYASLVEIKDGKLIIKNPAVMLNILRNFRDQIGRNTSMFIAKVIDEAGFSDGRRSVERLTQTRGELEEELRFQRPDSRDAKKTKGAIETLSQMILAGGEAIYLKKALINRAKNINDIFSDALGEAQRDSGNY